jgi:hypothetical protein
MIEDLWYKNTVIYSLDLETFMDANSDGVGGIEGLTRRLEYPDIENFAKSEKEKKLLNMVRAFRSIGTALLLLLATPKDRVDIFKEAVRKTHTDPDFINEYRKLTSGDEPTPLMPDEQAKIVREIPRDTEAIELFKKFAGTGPPAVAVELSCHSAFIAGAFSGERVGSMSYPRGASSQEEAFNI